ncbi:Undecaprenyl-diphosphatase [Quadrisphaera granulorum]|uniref:Undecaprenyl-diphosphatase n=1 Tax=Quadrisphaera granulorum TaxID=317664 RepID=A0A316A609_9ACTN|nr:undecaprenyl-diphosphate phosphatase [Quadrisphaera granulorum]PWJ52949.1 undecaprenyl-diphosphatase [Quadrisphaera granulorum]SZE97331.1 Undecaprenyl-diphosphatase [Quadrisphaera granulorum]
MEWWHAVLLGAVEGITEFLPVSSTGHLTILEKLLGYTIDDPDITAFTVIIQSGAVLATLLYLRRDIVRLIAAFLDGLRYPQARKNADWRMAIGVIVGSIPIGIIGFLFSDFIETTLRSLWVVGIALIGWSFVMLYADRTAKQHRPESSVTWRDTLSIGIVQCLALVPGVSRSGATMSIGLVLGLNRVTVTRLSFFLSIPALTAASLYQGISAAPQISSGIGWGNTLLATAVSFVVAYFTVDWLLKFIARHSYSVFIVYRIIAGAVVLALVGTGVVSAT